MQKIELEVANIPAHTRELVPLRANYDVLGGMPMVLVNAESLDEIMADKVLAFPKSLLDNEGRPVGCDSAKIRHRDIWDLAWMTARGAKLVPALVVAKIVKSRQFKTQMTRFIDASTIAKTLGVAGYDDYLAVSVGGLFGQMQIALNAMAVADTARPRHKKPKRKLRTAAKAANARHKALCMTIFVNGRQRKVPRPACIEGQSVHDFIRCNADPLWLHQNAMWELIADPVPEAACLASPDDKLFWD